MTTTPGNASRNLPGKPPVVDQATWQAAREELLVHEKAHTREGDRSPRPGGGCRWSRSTARSRSPASTGQSRFSTCPGSRRAGGLPLHVVQRRAASGAVRGLHLQPLAHERRRLPQRPRRLVRRPDLGHVGRGGSLRRVHGVHPALVLGAGRRGAAPRRGGHIICFLRDGDRVFLTYSTTGRGNEPADTTLGLLDMTPYGRREAWEDNPDGWPEAAQAGSPVGGHGEPICWYWRSDADGVATWGPTSRPVPRWTRPRATPMEALGRPAGAATALSARMARPTRGDLRRRSSAAWQVTCCCSIHSVGRWDRSPRRAAVVAEDTSFDGVGCMTASPVRLTVPRTSWSAGRSSAALAATVPRLAIGSLVLNVANRDAGTLAVMAATLQEVSGGRLLLGIGAGGGAGTPSPQSRQRWPPGPRRRRRRAAVEATIATLRQVWSGTAGGAGGFLRPSPSPPVIVGGFGPKMAELAGRLGDDINAPSGPNLPRLLDVAHEARVTAGRDPDAFSSLRLARPRRPTRPPGRAPCDHHRPPAVHRCR